MLLAGAVTSATAGVAGCLDTSSPEDRQHQFELFVRNDHDQSYEGRAVITDADGSTVFDSSFTLDPGDSREFADEVPTGEYTIVVELADRGESRSYWNTDLCEAYRDRTEIAADGQVSHHAICHAGDGEVREA